MIKIETVTNGIEDEIDRLANGPTATDLLKFEIILTQQFSATQIYVHKITTSLMRSGKMSSDSSNNSWEGQITYGGSTTGINNPVDYAEYERERGIAHDFLAPTESLSAGYIQAMNDFLGG